MLRFSLSHKAPGSVHCCFSIGLLVFLGTPACCHKIAPLWDNKVFLTWQTVTIVTTAELLIHLPSEKCCFPDSTVKLGVITDASLLWHQTFWKVWGWWLIKATEAAQCSEQSRVKQVKRATHSSHCGNEWLHCKQHRNEWMVVIASMGKLLLHKNNDENMERILVWILRTLLFVRVRKQILLENINVSSWLGK